MHYRVLLPHPLLRPWIGCYWVLKTDARFAEREEVILPDGYAEIILNMGAPYAWRSREGNAGTIRDTHLIGQREVSSLVRLPASLRQIGIKIKPMAMRALLQLPADQVANRLLDVSEVVPRAFDELSERLYETTAESAQQQLLDDFFLHRFLGYCSSQMTDDLLTQRALAQMLLRRGLLRMDELKNALGVDYRTLERRFKTTVGITPKEYARVIRFKNVYRAFCANQSVDPAFFLDWGYYDQSHYIREFRHFMGNTPTAFHTGTTPVADTILRQGLRREANLVE